MLKTVTGAFNGFFDFTAREALLVGVVTAIVQFGTAFVYGVTPADLDFSIFLLTTERFLEGQAMYSPDAMDFTPPLFHVLLLPLAHTDPRIAFTLWTAANVGVAWLVLRMVLNTVPGALDRRWVIAAWVANAAGVHMTIRLGQVSWLVALLVTSAWLAARSSRWVSAGFWAGLAIAFKPFLLVALPVFVVRKQWRVLVVCTTTIAASCGVGALVFGWPALTQWIGNLRATPDPAYATHFLNASWLGLIARAGLPYVMSSVLSGATILAVLWRVRSTSEDEAWLLFSIAAILGSPVGWVYYQPILLGPVVALAINGRWNSLRWLAFTGIAPALSKNLFQTPTIIALTLGSVYFWGFLVTLAALMLRPQTHFAVARWRDARSFFRAAPAAELRRTQVP